MEIIYKNRIKLMHELFEIDEEHQCKTCSNFCTHSYSRTYHKCSVYGISNSESTDWRCKWQACGMYNKDYNGTPIKDYAKHLPRKDKVEAQCEGQITFDEYLQGDI